MIHSSVQIREILSRFCSRNASKRLVYSNDTPNGFLHLRLLYFLPINSRLSQRRCIYTSHQRNCTGQKWKNAVVHAQQVAGNVSLKRVLFEKLRPDIEVIINKALACQESKTSVFQYFSNIDDLLKEDSAASWPGITSTLLCQSAVGLLPDQWKHPALLEDSKLKQKEVADFLNLLHIFYLVTLERYRKSVCWSGEGYFSWKDEWVTSYIYFSKYLVMIVEKACAQLRNDKAVEVMQCSMKTIGEMKYGIHFGRLPSGKRDLVSNLAEWKERTTQRVGHFLSSGFRTVLDTAGHSDEVQERFSELGKCLALAIQAHSDLQEFVSYNPSVNPTFDLCILPVVLYFQNEPELVNVLQKNKHALDERDYPTLHSAVSNISTVEETCQLINTYVEDSLKFLDNLEASSSKEALSEIITSLLEKS